jgi:hypothetical protein
MANQSRSPVWLCYRGSESFRFRGLNPTAFGHLTQSRQVTGTRCAANILWQSCLGLETVPTERPVICHLTRMLLSIRSMIVASCLLICGTIAPAQMDPAAPVSIREGRFLGIVPIYSTVSADAVNVKPMSATDKWRLAAAKSFDPAALLAAGVVAGIGQLNNQFPDWGQGAKGFSKRYGAAVTDQAVDDYLTIAVLPIILHEDPRYYRLGHGSFFPRLAYSSTRILVTHTDSGSRQFNFSEVLGNAGAAGITNLYYPERQRTLRYTVETFYSQLAADALFDVLKEFWPDIRRKFFSPK